MQSIKYLFFDLDGTIVDSSKGIKESFAHTFTSLGREVPSDPVLDSFIGPPLEVSLATVFKEEQLAEAIRLYRSFYKEKGVYGASPYPGIPQLLQELDKAGYELYVTTSKNEPIAKEMLALLGLDKAFREIFGSQPDCFHKADVLRRTITQIGANQDQSMIIGDTRFDVEGAQEVGIKSLAVLWGFGQAADLQQAGADYLLDSPEKVLQLLLDKDL